MVLMEAPAEIAREWAPKAVSAGAIVVDNSSAFRYDEDVPLVVPEINGVLLGQHHGIIASPNCTTLAMVPVLAPLDQCAELQHVVVASYQAVSGTGQLAWAELESQTRAYLANHEQIGRAGVNRAFAAGDVYPRPIAFNVIPQADSFLEDGTTKEEWKLMTETRKILERPLLSVSALCVRVPVFVGHSLALFCEFSRDLDTNAAQEILRDAAGVTLWPGTDYPTPLDIAGTDSTHVGRIHRNPGRDHSLAMWVCSDNLRKGAGLNNVQIAESLVDKFFQTKAS